MTDRTDDAIIRSEEELLVGTTWIASERVRVIKRVISEDVQVTVTLQREEIFIERAPIDAAEAERPRDRPVGEEALVFTLNREEPVVQARVVPAERVRVVKYVTDEARVIVDELRKERIELERLPVERGPDALGDEGRNVGVRRDDDGQAGDVAGDEPGRGDLRRD